MHRQEPPPTHPCMQCCLCFHVELRLSFVFIANECFPFCIGWHSWAPFLFYSFFLVLQIDFLLSIDGFTYQFEDFLPNFLYKWLTAKNEIIVLVFNKLSPWQKLQISALQRDHDLRMRAEDFSPASEVMYTFCCVFCTLDYVLILMMFPLKQTCKQYYA